MHRTDALLVSVVRCLRFAQLCVVLKRISLARSKWGKLSCAFAAAFAPHRFP